MASILDINSASSDSEDDGDYIPPEGAVSESSGGEDDQDDASDSECKQKSKKKDKRGSVVKPHTPEPEKPELDEKKREDDIWKSFLSDVETPVKPKTVVTPERVSSNSSTSKVEVDSDNPSTVVKEQNTSVSSLLEFAGETYKVEGSKVAPVPADITKDDTVLPKKRGLGSIMSTLSDKKKKVTTLQKSLYDWNDFKKEEGIEEDLETFNKGRGGFIERQRFLQRSDVRSFEIEKNLRTAKRH